MAKVNMIKHQYDKYVRDELAKSHGHKVCRLPSNHCELNSIELAWAFIKNHIAANSTTFKLPNVQKLVVQQIQLITKKDLCSWVQHIAKDEHWTWEPEGLDDEKEPIIITLSNESSDEGSEGSDNEAMSSND